MAPGTDVVRLSGGDILFRSDAVAVRIEGPSAALFGDRVVPLLDGSRTLDEVGALLPDIAVDDLRRHLDSLVDANVLRRDDAAGPSAGSRDEVMAPWLAFLESLGLPPEAALRRLRELRVAVAGLEGHGAHAASALAACGVGTVVLVDPYPCQPGNVALMPSAGPDAVGRPRQELLKARLQSESPATQVELAVEGEVTRAGVERASDGCHLLVSCFDKGLSSVSHWVNATGLAYDIPAVHAQLQGPRALVGPVVLPGQTACYLCWRMRSIACEEDYSAAMAYEEFLDGMKQPALHARGVFPALAPYVGGMVALEALKLLLLPRAQTLAGKVQVFNLLECTTEVHHVLQAPDCPACGKKARGGLTRPWTT